MGKTGTGPLFDEAPREVPLVRAPLVRTLAQISFNPVLVLRSEDTIAPFQEKIRGTYPKLAKEQLNMPPLFAGESEGRVEVIWRFFCPTSDWRVSVSSTFVALETVRYASRADLLKRVRVVLDALKSSIGALHVTRIGVRYVDQVRRPEYERISEMIREEVLGIYNSNVLGSMNHSVTETLFDTAEGGLIARWGHLPAFGTHDPHVMTPIDSESWFLDIDAYSNFGDSPSEMDSDGICGAAEALTKRAYTLFRWAVTENFLETYGRPN